MPVPHDRPADFLENEMPELPEAEVVRRQLQEALAGVVIERLWIGREDIVREGIETVSWYRRARILEVQRQGKSIAIVCERDAEQRVVIVELGMTGLLLFVREAVPSERHVHMVMRFARGPQLRYWNARRFGRVYLLDLDAWGAYCRRRFGPEPLTVTEKEFVALVETCRGRVKALLLHQQRIAGIGNIYANESLFRAGIHPHARGCRLSKRRIRMLFAALRNVLADAIRMGGSSIRNFVAPDGCPGQFQTRHQVYQKEGARCPKGCQTVIRCLAGERASFFCPTCQKR